ncbi:MAG: tyrosine-type recombinase/integrase [Kiloniellaceae bacterium]
MAKRSLKTARSVDSVKPDADRRQEVPDSLLPGLYLVVQPSGKRSWALRCRVDGKPAKITLGKVTDKQGLAWARDAARAKLEAIGGGEDPRPRKGARAAPEGAVALPATVGELADLYVAQHLKRNVRRWKAAEGEIDNHIRPHLGALRLDKVTRAHVRGMVTAIEPEAPVAANRALARCRALFNWGAARDMVTSDPTLGLKRPTKEKPVQRILSDKELVAVWRAGGQLGYPAREYLHFVILSGQRRDDVRLMHWREIDLERRDWTIPPERYKANRPQLVPLTDAMVALLEAMAFKDKGGFVFSAKGGETPYANLQKPKATLDKESKVTEWTLHDLRRTLRTGLSRLGIRPEVSERVLGHAVGGRLGQTYDTHSYRAEKLAALEAWDAHLRALLDGKKADNVVVLREAVQ